MTKSCARRNRQLENSISIKDFNLQLKTLPGLEKETPSLDGFTGEFSQNSGTDTFNLTKLFQKAEKEEILPQLTLTLCDPMDCSLPDFTIHGIFPGRSAGVGCHFLLQGIFPTQGLNPGLPHCRQMCYHLSHQGSHYKFSIIIKKKKKLTHENRGKNSKKKKVN